MSLPHPLRPLTGLLRLLVALGALLTGLWLAANTGAGRGWLAEAIGALSGGRVLVRDLGGRLPFSPRIGRLELYDASGAWLTLERAALDLTPGALLTGTIEVDDLTIGALALDRLPAARYGPGAPPRPPLDLHVRRLAVDALDLSGILPDAPVLGVSGAVTAVRGGDLALRLRAQTSSAGDRYRLSAITRDGLSRIEHLRLLAEEQPGGLAAQLAAAAGVELTAAPAPWKLEAEAGGPRRALAMHAEMETGNNHAEADGVIDLDTWSAAGLHIALDLPAAVLARPGMPDMAWKHLVAQADLEGPLRMPRARGWIGLDALAIGDWRLGPTNAELDGDGHRMMLDARVQMTGTPIPLSAAALATPLQVRAELLPGDPDLPLRFDARHPLLTIEAEASLRTRDARADAELADLHLLAAAAGLDPAWRPEGRANIQLRAGLTPARLDAGADVLFTDQPGPAAGLLGDSARLALSLDRRDGPWRLRSAGLAGAYLSAGAGVAPDGAPGLQWWVKLSDLGALAAPWAGRANIRGRLTGALAAPALSAVLDIQAAHPVAGSGRITGALEAEPRQSAGHLDVGGHWLGSPVSGRLDLTPADDGIALSMGSARWAGLSATGRLQHRRGDALPTGEMHLTVRRLADLGPIIAALRGETKASALAGALDARFAVAAPDRLSAEATGSGLILPGEVRIGSLALEVDASGVPATARVQGRMRLEGVAAGAAQGTLTVTATGPLAALDLVASSTLASPAGPLALEAAAGLDIPARRLELRHLSAAGDQRRLDLLSPAVVDFADGLSLSRLRLALDDGGSAELAGRLAPMLDFDASVRKLPLDLVGVMIPALEATGRLDADLRLSGRRDDPVIRLNATAGALHLSTGPGRNLPPARVALEAGRSSGRNEVDAGMTLGAASRLHLRGRIGAGSSTSAAALDLRADGRLDLSDLDRLLSIQGRQASGALVLDTRIGGVLTAPRIDGSLHVVDAAVRDFGIGLALNDIAGRLTVDANTLRIDRLTGRAGRGGFSLSGWFGPPAAAGTVDLRLAARDAEPVQLDQLQVRADADLSLTGALPQDLTLAGRVDLHRLRIGLPDRLPPTVVSLPVREQGTTRRPRPAATAAAAQPRDLHLDVEVSAPRSVELWGQGVDAELGGRLRLRGTLARPEADGGFRLLRGDYSLLGQQLRLTSGRIDFDGAAGLIPVLDLEARVTAAGSTAILALTGRATAPRIDLRGEPELPRDEVLSRLLFGVAGARLSPWQITQIGLAAASLAGIDVAGPDLVGRTRERLGLERLWIGTGERGTATLEGGRYIADGVYVGARQGTRTGETQGVLRVDLTPRVRLETDIGGRGTRTGAALELEY